MKDQHGRKIDYLRLSVTDRCNLRCRYCMPEEGVPYKAHHSMMTYEEIERLLRLLVELGLQRVRITGGEPLLRRGLVPFIGHISSLPGLNDLALSTNGTLLGEMAADLMAAGVSRVNVSLDTLNPAKFADLTRRDGLDQVLRGIDTALEVGFSPVKLNCVVIQGFNDDELGTFAELTRERPLHVRFIELMPLGGSYPWSADRFLTAGEIRQRFETGPGPLEPALVPGAGPAKYLRLPGAVGTIGFISAMSEHFCGGCNRIRLSADGKINPCLGALTAIDILGRLRAGATDDELREDLAAAIRMKPAEHQMNRPGSEAGGRRMSAIGG